MNLKEYYNYLVAWLKEEVKKTGAKGVVIGISGGIDSALVASIAKKAFPNNSLGILMPINKSRKFDVDHGIELCQKINLDYQIINLENEYIDFKNKINIQKILTGANLQARLRMITLYAIAQEKDYLVLGTDNKAEYDLGYFTKYGDGACDLLPIVHLFKSQVFELAKILDLPQNIIQKIPSGGLWENQEDEKELGFTYNDYEKFCKNELKNTNIKNKILLQIAKTEHKRGKIKNPDEMI
ncbi:MAG: NAD(+) synthase [Metamycoplasmataceae bacterium]